MPHTLSNKRQTIRQVMSGRVSEYICMSDSMPEYMSGKMSEYVSVSNKMSNGLKWNVMSEYIVWRGVTAILSQSVSVGCYI